MLLHQLYHDLVEVRAIIPALTAGEVHDLFRGLLVAVVAPIHMNARAIEMGKAGRKAQVLGRRRGHETVTCGHTRGIEGVQGPTQGVIVELCRGHAGRNQAACGLILEKSGDAVEHLIDTPQAIEHHRVDGFPEGEVPLFRVWLGGMVEDVANAEFVEHPRDKAKVVPNLTAVHGLLGHNYLLYW
jgi:hypothetical protein